MSARVQALRELLEQRYPDAMPLTRRTSAVVPTGIAALDGALPGRGLARGRLTAWSPGVGATAVLRSACRAAAGRGERTAWIDGAGVVCGDTWAGEAALFRPRGSRDALECAEELARSGGFGLVVVTGAETADTERVRLSRAVREGGGALVLVEEGGFMAALRVALRVEPGGYRWLTSGTGEPVAVEAVAVRARVEALGWSRETELLLSVACHDLRLSLESSLGDRRGAPR